MKFLFQVSRVRFWHYLAGSWLVGVALAAKDPSVFVQWGFWCGLLYWTLPANVLVYGVNDIADGDTDAYNPKKQGYEQVLDGAFEARLYRWIVGFQVPVVVGLCWFGLWDVLLLWCVWLVCSLGYSLPPIRAKARPFLDGMFNALYYLPGVIGYVWAGGEDISLVVLVAAQLWVMAMHAYSAVPDIDADVQAGIATTATYLGVRRCLVYCGILWLISAFLVAPFVVWLGVIGGSVYGGFIVLNLWSVGGKMSLEAQKQVFEWYRFFPGINFVFGMALFWYFYFPICSMILEQWGVFL